jgi:pimeloyl-ACP methyl ester carboxylesterase
VIVEANGIPFDIVETGSGDPPIVFIHGLACDATAWAAQMDDLSRDHRCIAINLRGRGATPGLPPFGVGQQAEDVAGVLDSLGVSGAIVVGHSLGGMVALLLNERRPDLVRGIVTGDSPVSSRGLDGVRLADAVRAAGSTEPARTLVENFWADGTSDAIREQVREMMLGCPPDVLAGMLEQSVSPERTLELIHLADQKPFMTIWAARPLGEPSWVRDNTVFTRQEPIAGAGHFFQVERPAVTNAILRAFLEEAERDPRVT